MPSVCNIGQLGTALAAKRLSQGTSLFLPEALN
jgi:hypothetical protein